MRNNVVLQGPSLPQELPREDFQATETVVKKIFADNGIECGEIDRTHRFGRAFDGRPRKIVVRFLRWSDKDRCVRPEVKAKLRAGGIYIKPQLPQEIVEIQRQLRDAAAKKWTLGDGSNGTVKAIPSWDTIKINGVKYSLDDNGELCNRYQARGSQKRQHSPGMQGVLEDLQEFRRPRLNITGE